MKWAFLIVLCLLAAAALEFSSLRDVAETDCHTVRALARHAPVVAGWISEALAEPFLGLDALGGAPAEVIASFRARSRVIISRELGTRLLPVALVEALRRVVLAQEGEPFVAALLTLPAASQGFGCRGSESPDPGSLRALEGRLVEASRAWLERKLQVPEDKAAFAHDREIFCKADKLIASLHSVAEAAAKKCGAAGGGSKLARGCAAGGSRDAVEAEIRDVEKEKELNLRKMREKWPARVMAGLRC